MAAESATAMAKPRPRLLPLAAEMLFIVLVALLVWLADIRVAIAVAAVAVAWVLAAVFEFARWRR
jgi:hypothetical protein